MWNIGFKIRSRNARYVVQNSLWGVEKRRIVCMYRLLTHCIPCRTLEFVIRSLDPMHKASNIPLLYNSGRPSEANSHSSRYKYLAVSTTGWWPNLFSSPRNRKQVKFGNERRTSSNGASASTNSGMDIRGPRADDCAIVSCFRVCLEPEFAIAEAIKRSGLSEIWYM